MTLISLFFALISMAFGFAEAGSYLHADWLLMGLELVSYLAIIVLVLMLEALSSND